MLLVLDRMLRLFDFVATEGGPVSVVWRMLANLLPEYLGLGIPIGLMLGILLAFRRLATIVRARRAARVGMSYARLLRVPYMYRDRARAAEPGDRRLSSSRCARYNYEQLRFELRTGALGASIKVGEFTNLGDRMTLRIEESRERGARPVGHLRQRADAKDGDWISVTAEQGQFLRTDDPERHHLPPDQRHADPQPTRASGRRAC